MFDYKNSSKGTTKKLTSSPLFGHHRGTARRAPTFPFYSQHMGPGDEFTPKGNEANYLIS
jgi:hypothetical protein